MKGVTWSTHVFFSVLIFVGACSKVVPPPEPLRPVLTNVLGTSESRESATYSGEVRSRYETPLGFRISGKISARLVDTGAFVKPGDVLARLDSIDTVLSSNAANAQLDLAEAEMRRYRELRNKNFVSQSALDAKETALKTARAQADLASNQNAYTVLRADQSGVVSQIMAEVGQVVSAGQPVMRVARTDMLEVAVSIPEARMPDVRLGQQAEVSLWAAERSHYKGVLRELSRVADPVTRTYAARVSILKPDAKIMLGMTANVKILRGNGEKGVASPLSVPLTAIFQHEGKPALWIVSPDQTVSLREVVVASYGETFAVLTNGVRPGERFVIAGVHKLSDGEKIKAVDAVSAPQFIDKPDK